MAARLPPRLSASAGKRVSSSHFPLNIRDAGRLTNGVDAVGTTKYTYANGLLATEDGPWANDTVAWDHNTARKRSALRLQQIASHWWTNSYAWDTSHRVVDWYPTSTERFVYDGMLLVQERNTSAPTVSYTRGVDLSGGLNGAGGIGGLLARSHGFSGGSGTWSTHSAYHAGGNGNVTGLYSTSTGSQVGLYRYDAFGRLLQSSGSLASANRMRFSSKPWMAPGVDASAGLYYYGYRFYDPNTQRWVNRDPIGERGGESLYAFVGNSPVMFIDPVGLKCTITITAGHNSIENEDTGAMEGGTEYEFNRHRKRFRSGLLQCDKFGYVGCGMDDQNDMANREGFGFPGMPTAGGNQLIKEVLIGIYIEKALAAARNEAAQMCNNKCACEAINIVVRCEGVDHKLCGKGEKVQCK